jgi:hypothetical protein
LKETDEIINSNRQAQLTDFNFSHPLLQRVILPDERAELQADQFAPSSPLEDEIWNLAREAAADRSTPDTPDDQLRIASTGLPARNTYRNWPASDWAI